MTLSTIMHDEYKLKQNKIKQELKAEIEIANREHERKIFELEKESAALMQRTHHAHTAYARAAKKISDGRKPDTSPATTPGGFPAFIAIALAIACAVFATYLASQY